ncbi:MAG: rod shape-determining protein RodA [Gaiellales bacterium]|nr:rod shape-determining protein RodA [Gaiellales bacterium]
MTLASLLRRVDWLLVAAVLLLLYIGERAVKVATVNDIAGDPGFFDRRHIVYIIAGLALGAVAAFVDPRVYRRLFWPIYGSTIGLLVIVLGFSAARGSQRWIQLPFFTLQPSELGKATMIVCLSLIVADCVRRGIMGWRLVIRASLLMLPPFALVFIQPDLGTSIVYVAITLTILVVAGLSGRILAVIGGVGVMIVVLVLGILPTVGVPLLRPYQTERITAFLDPQGGSPAAYQGEQSKIAIGSGGLAGRGQGASQTAGNFLPEHHTDFVFAVVGENRGFVGAAVVLLLYLLVLWRIGRIIPRARNLEEAFIAAGAFGLIILQVAVNVGMNLGIAPTTGIPLPFMTYGGSNTLTNLTIVGLAVAVGIRQVREETLAPGWRERPRRYVQKALEPSGD